MRGQPFQGIALAIGFRESIARRFPYFRFAAHVRNAHPPECNACNADC